MSSYNKVILLGNLTRDPQLKYLANQTAVCEFGIATNRKYKVQDDPREEVTFVDVTAFGKQAEVIAQYMKKGKPIYVEGRMQTRSWEGKEDGKKQYKTEVVVETFQFGPSTREDGDRSDSSAQDSTEREPQQAAGEEINAEDIPF